MIFTAPATNSPHYGVFHNVTVFLISALVGFVWFGNGCGHVRSPVNWIINGLLSIPIIISCLTNAAALVYSLPVALIGGNGQTNPITTAQQRHSPRSRRFFYACFPSLWRLAWGHIRVRRFRCTGFGLPTFSRHPIKRPIDRGDSINLQRSHS